MASQKWRIMAWFTGSWARKGGVAGLPTKRCSRSESVPPAAGSASTSIDISPRLWRAPLWDISVRRAPSWPSAPPADAPAGPEGRHLHRCETPTARSRRTWRCSRKGLGRQPLSSHSLHGKAGSETAVGDELGAGAVRALVAGQEKGQPGDLVGPADAPEWQPLEPGADVGLDAG